MSTLKVETFQYINIEYEYAGAGNRLLARIIDLMICYAYFLFMAVIWGASTGGFARGRELENVSIIIACILMLPLVMYTFLSEWLMQGQTLGKKAMKIKVISLNGRPVRLSQYLLRWLFVGIDVFFLGIGLVMIAITSKNQRLGDLVAGTTCVSLESSKSKASMRLYTFAPDYRPVFLNVTKLSDQDIQLLKEIYETSHKGGLQYLTIVDQASEKMRALLSLQGAQYAGVDFIKAIIMDYTYLSKVGEQA